MNGNILKYVDEMNRCKYSIYIILFISALRINSVYSQELEPRALTNIPVGMNFAIAGYAYSQGNLLFDPALPLEDTDAKLHMLIGAYARSINFFGLSGKMDLIVPYGIGDWTGVFTGIDTATSRSGFGDLRFRLSFNFLGAPALKASQFRDYSPGRISGFSLQVIAPTGQYYPDRLINLGTNRWTFKPQWGYAWNFEKWIWETYASAWIYTKNKDFWGGNELRLNPLFALKLHGIRKLKKGNWFALNVGYGIGARGYINDERKDNRISTIRLMAVYAIKLGKNHTLRIDAKTGIRFEKGADFNAIGLSYQYNWVRRPQANE
jgi:hypothetical protein